MTLKLYYSPGACSLADHIALIENGLPFTLEKVDLKAHRTASGEDFYAINPKGYVPALVMEDGTLLTENIAILIYIAEKGGKLLPASGAARYNAISATAYIGSELHKNFKPFFSNAGDAEKQAGLEVLQRRLAFLEDGLKSHAFIAGDEMSIADCYFYVVSRWAEKFGVPLPERLAALAAKLAGRPAVKEALANE